MKVIKKSISELSFDPANVRKHDNKNLDAIKASLNRFGQQKPIVIDTKMVVRAGNGTLAAAKELGWTNINVVVSDLPRADLIAYGIADNRTAELAEWDVEGLTEQLAGLDEELREIAYSDFDLAELDDIDKPEPNEKDDEIPEVDENPYGVQLGDIWQLGNHRLMCGDSTDKEQVLRLLSGVTPDIIYTDPPYGMNAVSKSGVLSKNYKRDIEGDDNTDAAKLSFKLIYSMFNKSKHVWWGANYYSNVLPDSECWLVWNKNNGESDQTDCELAWANFRSVVRMFTQASEKTNRVHPTQKPVSLIEWVFRRFKYSANTMFDPFLGSGSTLIACEKTNRKCFGSEIDPHYCSVIIKRWEDFTGQKAIKLEEK